MKLLRTLTLGWGLLALVLAPALPAFAQATINTTTTLATSANSVAVGIPVTLTATVVAASGTGPTGTVTFKNGTTTLGTATLSGTGRTRTASFSATFATVASNSLTAVYAGDATNRTSTSTAKTVTSTKANTTTTLTSASSVAVGTPVTLTATVVAASGTGPTGTVTFKNGTTTLGTATLSGTGRTRTASFSATFATVASNSLTAVYAGDATNKTSTSTARTVTSTKATSTSTVVSSLNPSTSGASVTFTASVSGYTPTGNVAFKDGTTTLGTVALSGTGNTRTASFSTSTLSIASHNITAVYAGNTLNKTSTSAILSQVVKRATTTALSSSANPSTYGASVTLTATISGGTSPTGMVTFRDGATTVGSATVSAGQATLAIATLAGGSHSLTAVYGGDATNATSTSATLSQVVNKRATTTALSSSANPSTYGASITLTATISGGTSPTGTVTFRDGATTLGSANLSGTTASFTTSALSAGSHSITASYAGDVNNASSSSTALNQVITQSAVASTTTLTATPGSASAGSSVSLSATVSGNNPTGSVTFSDGSTVLGSANLIAGTATLTTSALTTGGHSISAQYTGNAGNLASNSNSVLVNITPAGTTPMTWKYGYDAMGRPTSTIDPNNLATYTYYDSLGRPIQSQQPANTGSATPTVIDLEYNLADSLTKVTDPRSLSTTYSPNGLGNVTAQSSPDTGASSYTYDAKGNVLTATDARGKVTTMVYDNLDRLISISYPTGTPTTLQYDGGTSPYAGAKGELTQITDESGTTSYAYDSAGRLITKTQVTNGKTFTVAYAWGDSGSALDKLIRITYPSGNQVNYTYDAQGYPSAMTVSPVNANGSGVGTAQNLLSAITTNADGNPTGWLWANGKSRTIGYDSFGQIASYSLGDAVGTGNSAGTLRSLIRDGAGRITGYSHTNSANPSAAATLNQAFGYDNLNRLINATVGNTTTQYAYDATGNRTSKTIGASSYTNTVSPTSNKYTQTQDVTGTASIQYDAAGHITNDGTNSFTYSDRGRMATASNAGGTVNYLYNAANLRVAKTGPTALVATGASYYVFDEAGQLLGEYDASQTPIYETIYLGNTPVGVLKQTGTAGANNIATSLNYVHADHLATARVITRASDNAIVWRWDSAEAFGATAPNQNPNALGTFVYNPRFPGQVFDSETGLNQNWNREYDARQGRYRQSDPIGLAGGINTFAYVGGNPLSFADPTGEYAQCVAGPIGVLSCVATGAVVGYRAYRTYQAVSTVVNAAKAESEKTSECECDSVTQANINAVLAHSTVKTYQPTVSGGVISSYIAMIKAGTPLPPINMDDKNAIVDGNHRYIATKLCHKEPLTRPWSGPLSKIPMPITGIVLQP